MCSKQHISSRLSRTLCICEWVLKIFLFFSHSKFNATAPGVKWLVFPWRVALELSRVIPSYSSRQWETHAFSDFGGKMGFLGHNVGFRHARRSRNGSIDAGDHLVSNKSLSQNFANWIGVQGPSKLVKTRTFLCMLPIQAAKGWNLFSFQSKTNLCSMTDFFTQRLKSISISGQRTFKERLLHSEGITEITRCG